MGQFSFFLAGRKGRNLRRENIQKELIEMCIVTWSRNCSTSEGASHRSSWEFFLFYCLDLEKLPSLRINIYSLEGSKCACIWFSGQLDEDMVKAQVNLRRQLKGIRLHCPHPPWPLQRNLEPPPCPRLPHVPWNLECQRGLPSTVSLVPWGILSEIMIKSWRNKYLEKKHGSLGENNS